MKKMLAALLIGVLSFFIYIPALFAYSQVIWYGPMPASRIEPVLDENTGFLVGLNYYIQSTGAVSGIRYRTTKYYITIRNFDGTTAVYQFEPIIQPPPPGETLVYKITITDQDLIGAGADPETLGDLSRISIGADLEVYNADTGAVLRTIYNGPTSVVYPQIDRLKTDFGFSDQHIYDMKTRYIDTLLDLETGEPPPGGEACSLDEGSVYVNEQESGRWSYDYWGRVEYSETDEDGSTYSYTVCEVVNTVTGPYYEKLEMSISTPSPRTVKAGQGTEIIVTTKYRNNNPAAWRNGSYTTGVRAVTMSGPDTEDWEHYRMYGDRITENMILKDTRVYYEPYRSQTYSTGCNGGYFEVGYNVPVVEQTWIIPYARFDEISGWTRHQTMPADIDNRTVFGGLNRWYFGFDIPDGQTFLLRFMAKGGSTGDLTVCGGTTVTIKGSPYDDIIVRTVDPNNPFPGGTPVNWQGKEHYITQLAGWYREPEKAYQQKLERWKAENALQRAYEYMVGHLMQGIKRLIGDGS